MSSQPVKDIEAALRDMQALAGESTSRSGKKSAKASRKRPDKTAKKKSVNPVTWFIRWTISLLVLIVLPFLLLIRLSVYLHVVESLNIWVAVAASIGATTLLLLFYVAFLQKRMTGNWGFSRRKIRLVLAIVVIYSGYSLLYVSGNNVKSPEVASTYLSLHPTLRLATSSLVLINKDLVVTDMARTPEDYIKMGLPIQENSSHYVKESGFVEAVDIRTKSQPEWVNLMVELYFKSMGFSTLRHVGTADHLHVALPR